MPDHVATVHPSPAPTIRVGRQAIFDRQLQLYGYELLYRGPRESNGDRASSLTLLDAFLELGIERVVGPHRAFVNLTQRFFTELPPLPLAPGRMVLEILEDIPVDQALLDGLRALRGRGFQIALDDYQYEAKWEPVLPLVDIVKVDVPGAGWPAIEQQTAALRDRGLRLLAEKVETHQDYQRLHDLGFDYFQGFFFARPHTVTGRRMPENHAVLLRLLARINDPEVSIQELEALITQDPSLSYKVLRFINSAAVGLPRQIDSIRQAVVYMGLERIRGWATLLTLSGVEKRPQELILLGLVRAYQCETLLRLHGQGSPEKAYTVGLFSILDALLDLPMRDILGQLPLPAEVNAALLEHSGLYGKALNCALALEQGSDAIPACDGLSPDLVAESHLDSLQRADTALTALR
jgi:EAL and modified HD-GYP domain-containing signal transduction protein